MFTGYEDYQDFGFSIKDIRRSVKKFAKAVGQPVKMVLKNPKSALSFKKQYKAGKAIGKSAEGVAVSLNPADRYLQKFDEAGIKAGGVGKLLGRVGEKARKNPIATTAIVYGAATAIGKGLASAAGKGTVVKGAGGLVASTGGSATGAAAAGTGAGAGITASGVTGGAGLLQKAKEYVETAKEASGIVKGATGGTGETEIVEDSPGFIQAGMFGNISPITIGLFLTASAIAYFAFAPKSSR